MAFIQTVDKYAAFLYPNQGKSEGRINLYCGEYKLYLLFKNPSDPLPYNTYNASIKTGVAYQSFDAYSSYIDLLRNEKPISVTFRPEDAVPTYVVYCASEPPGEGEI